MPGSGVSDGSATAGETGPRIDLHTHSAFSDGTDSAPELLAAAVAAGLSTVAITDHDTTAGWDAFAESLPVGMTLIRGAELSTHVMRGAARYSIHLLAYLFDPTDRELSAEMARLRDDRLVRGSTIVQRLVAGGVPISLERVVEIASGAPIGRPHIARALMEGGLVGSVTEAFGSYLSPSGPYYVAKADTELSAALSLVREAGGVPVIAHPRSRGAAAITDEDFFRWARAGGLAGIEVDHPDHGMGSRQQLRAIAESLDLLMTGSSDYHGANKLLRLGQETTAEKALAQIVQQSSGRIPPVTAPVGAAG